MCLSPGLFPGSEEERRDVKGVKSEMKQKTIITRVIFIILALFVLVVPHPVYAARGLSTEDNDFILYEQDVDEETPVRVPVRRSREGRFFIPEEQPIIGEQSRYTLGSGDVLDIKVKNQPDFSARFVVGFEGTIQYFWLGEIKVEGLTRKELVEVMKKTLKPYVNDPEVIISILAYRSKKYYLIGEVSGAGKYYMQSDSLTLRDALMRGWGAGGGDYGHLRVSIGSARLRYVRIIKSDPVHPTFVKVNLYDILYKGKLKDDITIYPGDIIYVPTRILVKITRFFRDLTSPLTGFTGFKGAERGVREEEY